jgi:hypothetical protein
MKSKNFLYSLTSVILTSFLVSVFIVFADNPPGPFEPADNIQDPGDPATPGTGGVGCLITDSNCFITVNNTSPVLSDVLAADATNTINNTNYLQEWQWNTLAGTSGLKLSSTSTLATGNAQKLFEVSLSGANDNATQTTYGGYFSNTHTGATSTNVGLYATASGGTTNYAIQTSGAILLDNIAITNNGTNSISFGGGTPSVNSSFFFGENSGSSATSASNSNFLGNSAGYQATSASGSNFFGYQSGYQATNANNSNFFGYQSGYQATNADNSVFFGYQAGYSAENASDAIFIGESAGANDTVDNSTGGYSILLGPDTSTGGFSNSIAIARGATNTASNQLVIGSSTASSYIDSIFFGSGVTAATPIDYAINGSGASGTDIGGGDVTIAGGKATGNASGGSILFQTSNAGASGVTLQSLTTKMTILASGFVGISNTAPGVALHVGSASTTDGTTLLRLEDANSTCNFTADAGAPTCGSDRRLKTDIQDLDTNDILEKLTSLDTVSYRWKTESEDAPLQYGFIAQNVQDYFPNLVKEGEWIDGSQKLFLSMSGLMPYAVASIKELDLKLNDIQDFEDEGSNFGEKLRVWISSIENKISRIFVGELCLTEDEQDTVCINRGELKSLKELIEEPINSGNSSEEENNEDNLAEEEVQEENVEEETLDEEVILENQEEIIEEEIPLEEVEDMPVQVGEIIEEPEVADLPLETEEITNEE